MSQLTIFINILILLALGIGLPTLVVFFLSLFKIKINKTGQMYLYSFAAGLIIILGTVGFIGEAISHSREHFESLNQSSNALSILQIVGLVGGGSIIGVSIVFFIRWLVTRGKHELHEHHHHHDHNEEIFNASDIDNKKLKWLPILLLLGHRCVDGITLGFMANTASNEIAGFDNWGMIITFAIHLIPTTIIIYLIQLDIQHNKRWKALLITIGMLLIMVPFTLIGGFLIANIQDTVWWLMPLLFAISGSIMTLMSIIELIPEFIHFRNSQKKQWITSIVLLSIGIILAVILTCVHME